MLWVGIVERRTAHTVIALKTCINSVDVVPRWFRNSHPLLWLNSFALTLAPHVVNAPAAPAQVAPAQVAHMG